MSNQTGSSNRMVERIAEADSSNGYYLTCQSKRVAQSDGSDGLDFGFGLDSNGLLKRIAQTDNIRHVKPNG